MPIATREEDVASPLAVQAFAAAVAAAPATTIPNSSNPTVVLILLSNIDLSTPSVRAITWAEAPAPIGPVTIFIATRMVDETTAGGTPIDEPCSSTAGTPPAPFNPC